MSEWTVSIVGGEAARRASLEMYEGDQPLWRDGRLLTDVEREASIAELRSNECENNRKGCVVVGTHRTCRVPA